MSVEFRLHFILPIILLFPATVSAFSETPTPPGQPAIGPGGSNYLYDGYQQFGPYYVNPAEPEPYQEFYIFEPSDGELPASLPVVLFLQGYFLKGEGYPLGDSPQNYTYWLEHLARKGYTVVFPEYDYTLQPTEYTQSIILAWQAALQLLASGASGLIPPAVDSMGPETLFTGHSMGAYQCFAVAQQLTLNPEPGLPIPRAIAAFNPAVNGQDLSTNFAEINPTTSVVLVEGDEDVKDIPTAEAIWDSIVDDIPASQRDYLEVISDSHGSPAQLGNHYYPDTNGYGDDDSGVDDRDYNVTWKLSVGLFDCVLNGQDCEFGLGHGSPSQTSMGDWSDGTPVTPLHWIR